MKKSFIAVALLMALFIQARHWTVAYAASNNLYAHNYSTVGVAKFDSATFTIADTYTNLTSGNGRGVVVISGTMYYTDASTGNVYTYNTATHTNNGVLFTVTGASGISTASFDGTNLWLSDYSGTNKAFNYSLTGTLVKTITLPDCGSYCDGLTYFTQSGQGRLISNEGDEQDPATYDIYDTNGTLLTHAFITTNATQCSCSGRGSGNCLGRHQFLRVQYRRHGPNLCI